MVEIRLILYYIEIKYALKVIIDNNNNCNYNVSESTVTGYPSRHQTGKRSRLKTWSR